MIIRDPEIIKKDPWMEGMDVSIEDFNSDELQMIAEIIGVESTIRLIQELGGINVAIPKKGLNVIKKRFLITNYDGNNMKRIAVTLGISSTYASRIIQDYSQDELF